MPRTQPPNDIDRRIGARLRQRREDWDISAAQLGAAVGVSPQQILKYEKAQSKVSASRLSAIAHQLQMPVLYFLENTESLPDDTIGNEEQNMDARISV